MSYCAQMLSIYSWKRSGLYLGRQHRPSPLKCLRVPERSPATAHSAWCRSIPNPPRLGQCLTRITCYRRPFVRHCYCMVSLDYRLRYRQLERAWTWATRSCGWRMHNGRKNEVLGTSLVVRKCIGTTAYKSCVHIYAPSPEYEHLPKCPKFIL